MAVEAGRGVQAPVPVAGSSAVAVARRGARGDRPGLGPGRRVGGGDLAGRLGGRRGLRRLAGGPVHGGVGERVGVLVAFARNPAEGHRVEPAHQRRRLGGQRAQTRVLDLPAAGHLLDDQFGVQPGLHHARPELGGGLQPGDQPLVLGDVVGGDPDRLGTLGQHRAGGGVADHRAVPGGSGVAPGAAVGLDDNPVAHRPDSLVRTMIRRHSSQRTTSSGAAARIRALSPAARSRRQPPQRPPVSSAAPSPPELSLIFS